jgi:hypothetical protein
MMPTLPAELLPFIVEFQPLFSNSVWKNAQTLLVGAILSAFAPTGELVFGLMADT